MSGISTEHLGGARRIKRRLAGCIRQEIAFHLPETRRSLGTPETVFQILIIVRTVYNFMFFVVLFVKKWPATQLISAAAAQQE